MSLIFTEKRDAEGTLLWMRIRYNGKVVGRAQDHRRHYAGGSSPSWTLYYKGHPDNGTAFPDLEAIKTRVREYITNTGKSPTAAANTCGGSLVYKNPPAGVNKMKLSFQKITGKREIHVLINRQSVGTIGWKEGKGWYLDARLRDGIKKCGVEMDNFYPWRGLQSGKGNGITDIFCKHFQAGVLDKWLNPDAPKKAAPRSKSTRKTSPRKSKTATRSRSKSTRKRTRKAAA